MSLFLAPPLPPRFSLRLCPRRMLIQVPSSLAEGVSIHARPRHLGRAQRASSPCPFLLWRRGLVVCCLNSTRSRNIIRWRVSRGKWGVFARLCQNLRLRPVQLPVPQNCHGILQRLLDLAKAAGKPVRPNPYVSTPTHVLLPLLHLVQPAQPSFEPVAKRARLHSITNGQRCSVCGAILSPQFSGSARCAACMN